ncbi:uncharacterized protein LOC129230110 isoform X1 [Uloborus diversus]|uniref:uncharacterized protein LOC129230110 isoform X1 n=1 Tax=Uloborus diversus TaxID=327109 RepID=UPI00240A78E1|nr:uncharacterized protein LOC129230110 isoform X1 [Uloborus diversus]
MLLFVFSTVFISIILILNNAREVCGHSSDACDWVGSGLHHRVPRGVQPLYLRCTRGHIKWHYPRGALRALLRPRLTNFQGCIRVSANSTGARLFLEGEKRLYPLYRADDGKPEDYHRCFTSRRGQVALYIEADPPLDILRKDVVEFSYDLVPQENLADDMEGEAVRCKWKHLRDNFRKEFKKCAKEADKGTDPEKFQSGWIWYSKLFFLGDQLITRKTNPCKYGKMRKWPTEDSGGENQGIDLTSVKEEMHIEENSQSSSVDTLQNIQIPEVQLTYDDDDDSKKLSDSLDSDFDFKSRKRKTLTPGADRYDDTYHFLMSLMSPIKSLPFDRQMFVRWKIQELLFNETVNYHQIMEGSDRTVDLTIGMSQDSKR